MFGVGLQFHFEHLVNVWRVALPGAILQSLCATLLGALVTRMFGWTWPAGLVFGAALSVASTVVLVRVLADNRDLETPTGRIAVGWLVIEDLFTVLLLVLLPAVVAHSTFDARLGAALGITLLKVTALVVIVFLLGQRAIPWLLERAAATRSREIFTLTILVVALGLAVGSARFFGVSMALGAFLAGMIVGRTEYSSQAAAEAMPMRDAFAVLFFVSVGMLLEPGFLIASPLLVAATLAVVLIGKPLAALAVVRLMGYSRRVAFGVGVSLAQVGEFSFILASVGYELGVLSAAATQTIVAVAIISIMLNPVLYRLAQVLQLDDDESLTPDLATKNRSLRRPPPARLDGLQHAGRASHHARGASVATPLAPGPAAGRPRPRVAPEGGAAVRDRARDRHAYRGGISRDAWHGAYPAAGSPPVRPRFLGGDRVSRTARGAAGTQANESGSIRARRWCLGPGVDHGAPLTVSVSSPKRHGFPQHVRSPSHFRTPLQRCGARKLRPIERL